jgi:hypothetical protein
MQKTEVLIMLLFVLDVILSAAKDPRHFAYPYRSSLSATAFCFLPQLSASVVASAFTSVYVSIAISAFASAVVFSNIKTASSDRSAAQWRTTHFAFAFDVACSSNISRPQKLRHPDRSRSQSHRERRSGGTPAFRLCRCRRICCCLCFQVAQGFSPWVCLLVRCTPSRVRNSIRQRRPTPEPSPHQQKAYPPHTAAPPTPHPP